jgi:hypothetical protein
VGYNLNSWLDSGGTVQGLFAWREPTLRPQVQPLIEGALARGTLAMQCRARDAFTRWTRSSRLRDVKASHAPLKCVQALSFHHWSRMLRAVETRARVAAVSYQRRLLRLLKQPF